MPKGLTSLLLTLLMSAAPLRAVAAQPSNGTSTLLQDTIGSGGDRIGNSAFQANTTVGLPAGGLMANTTFQIIGGMGILAAPLPPPVNTTVTVTGTVSELSCTVTVNGVPAAVVGQTFTAQGVRLLLGPNTVTAEVTDRAGNLATDSIVLYLDLPDTQKTPRILISVAGTVNDTAATVSVSGVTAVMNGGIFSVAVPGSSGYNTLTAIAIDPAGNAGAHTIRVFVPMPTRPPAMPTVGTVGTPIPEVTTQTSIMIGGTKTAGTTIWINGAAIASALDALTWTATLNLIEGDNWFSVLAKDATGTASVPVNINIILDREPPVITLIDPPTSPTKTNFNPFLLKASVDDSQTGVVLTPSATVTASGRMFEAPVTLLRGLNTVTMTATSPRGLQSTRSLVLNLGTIPVIQTWQPADGTKAYPGATLPIQISATDQEADAIEYRVLLDTSTLIGWGAPLAPWTPGTNDLGFHTMSGSARDAYGGSNNQDSELLILRKPIDHPATP